MKYFFCNFKLLSSLEIALSTYSLLLFYLKTYGVSLPLLLHIACPLFMFSVVYLLGANAVGKIHRLFTPVYFPISIPESCCTVSVIFPVSNLNATVDYLIYEQRKLYALTIYFIADLTKNTHLNKCIYLFYRMKM